MAAWRLSCLSSLTRATLPKHAHGHVANLRLASLSDAPLPLPLCRQAAPRVPSFATDILRCFSSHSRSGFNAANLNRPAAPGQLTRRTSTPLSSISLAHLQSVVPATPVLTPLPPSRGFRLTTPQSAAPMVVVVAAKQAAKVISILLARFFRNRYRKKSDEEKALIKERIRRHKRKFYTLMWALFGVGIAYGITHLERTPFTRRYRLVARFILAIQMSTDLALELSLKMTFSCRCLTLTPPQSLELAKLELANQMAQHSPNFMDQQIYIARVKNDQAGKTIYIGVNG